MRVRAPAGSVVRCAQALDDDLTLRPERHGRSVEVDDHRRSLRIVVATTRERDNATFASPTRVQPAG